MQKRGQYPAILTKQTWSIMHLLLWPKITTANQNNGFAASCLFPDWQCHQWKIKPKLLLSVASKYVHVRKKHVVNGGKHDTFCRQTFEVWSRRLLSTWFVFTQKNIFGQMFLYIKNNFGGKCAVSKREICTKAEKNEIWVECADQKHINNLPLVRQFALTADKLLMFGGKTRHVWHPIRTMFFVLYSRLVATDGIASKAFCLFTWLSHFVYWSLWYHD